MINLINRNCPICLESIETEPKMIPDLDPEVNNEFVEKYWSRSGTENNNKKIFFSLL